MVYTDVVKRIQNASQDSIYHCDWSFFIMPAGIIYLIISSYSMIYYERLYYLLLLVSFLLANRVKREILQSGNEAGLLDKKV